jgi:hypothetical protein
MDANLETGRVENGDRPGVYIEFDQCIAWAADIRDALRDGKPLLSWVDRTRLEELAKLLESVK